MIVYPDLAMILGLVIYGSVFSLAVYSLELPRPRWQILLCVVLSALTSAVSLLPYISSSFLLLIGLSVMIALVRGKTVKGTFLNVLHTTLLLFLYLGLWFVLCGALFLFSILFSVQGGYVLLSFGRAFWGATLAGGVLFLFLRIRKRRGRRFALVACELDLEGKTISLMCYPDSGNFLTDPISGDPVVIIEYSAIFRRVSPPLPKPMTYEFAARFGPRARVIAYRTVSESGQMLSSFVPDAFRVEGIPQAVVVAVTSRPLDVRGRFNGIIGPDLWKGD
ncbi:MAG: sigma-E processing peptidase SpoIIGA [Clostridia bacterium]|nr:sigma-E processing peptidase SpoIIGA [Clostridia bacterium]